jgi:hypothetical protein
MCSGAFSCNCPKAVSLRLTPSFVRITSACWHSTAFRASKQCGGSDQRLTKTLTGKYLTPAFNVIPPASGLAGSFIEGVNN